VGRAAFSRGPTQRGAIRTRPSLGLARRQAAVSAGAAATILPREAISAIPTPMMATLKRIQGRSCAEHRWKVRSNRHWISQKDASFRKNLSAIPIQEGASVITYSSIKKLACLTCPALIWSCWKGMRAMPAMAATAPAIRWRTRISPSWPSTMRSESELNRRQLRTERSRRWARIK
jgi:hypothetical protein